MSIQQLRYVTIAKGTMIANVVINSNSVSVSYMALSIN